MLVYLVGGEVCAGISSGWGSQCYTGYGGGVSAPSG